MENLKSTYFRKISNGENTDWVESPTTNIKVNDNNKFFFFKSIPFPENLDNWLDIINEIITKYDKITISVIKNRIIEAISRFIYDKERKRSFSFDIYDFLKQFSEKVDSGFVYGIMIRFLEISKENFKIHKLNYPTLKPPTKCLMGLKNDKILKFYNLPTDEFLQAISFSPILPNRSNKGNDFIRILKLRISVTDFSDCDSSYVHIIEKIVGTHISTNNIDHLLTINKKFSAMERAEKEQYNVIVESEFYYKNNFRSDFMIPLIITNNNRSIINSFSSIWRSAGIPINNEMLKTLARMKNILEFLELNVAEKTEGKILLSKVQDIPFKYTKKLINNSSLFATLIAEYLPKIDELLPDLKKIFSDFEYIFNMEIKQISNDSDKRYESLEGDQKESPIVKAFKKNIIEANTSYEEFLKMINDTEEDIYNESKILFKMFYSKCKKVDLVGLGNRMLPPMANDSAEGSLYIDKIFPEKGGNTSN